MPFALNGKVRIHYDVHGTGPPLLLHHGGTGSSRDWIEFGFVAGLRRHYQLIMLDARGHGASDKPHDPAAYAVEQRIGDIAAVLDELSIERAHYYGYSYGGMMGWALGMYAPERFASLAIGGAHPYPLADDVWTRLERMHACLCQGMATYVAWRESQSGPWPADFRDRVLDNDPQALVAFVRAERAQERVLRFAPGIPRMKVPVLVISGDNDEMYAGSRARRAAAELANGRFIEIPDADHFKLYNRSDLILPHLTLFLSQITDPQPVLAAM